MLIIITILSAVIFLLGMSIFFADKAGKEKYVRWFYISLMAVTIIQFAISYKYQSANDVQQDHIDTTTSKTNELANILYKLDNETNRLTQLNNKLSDTINYIVHNVQTLQTINNNLSKDINKNAAAAYNENRFTGEFSFDLGKPIKDDDHVTLIAGMQISVTPRQLNHGSGILVYTSRGEPFKFYVQNGRLLFSAELYDINNNVILTVDKNKWWINKKISSKLNYDSKGFEIVDDQNNVIFNLNVINDRTIRLNGYYFASSEMVEIMNGNISSSCYLNDQQCLQQIKKIPKLFRYTGNQWVGVRNN